MSSGGEVQQNVHRASIGEAVPRGAEQSGERVRRARADGEHGSVRESVRPEQLRSASGAESRRLYGGVATCYSDALNIARPKFRKLSKEHG